MVAERGALLRVINSGVAGDRVRNIRQRLESDCLACRPEIVTLLIGVNDTWRRYDSDDPTPVDQFAADYDATLCSVRKAGIETLIVMEPFLVPINEKQRRWRIDDLEPKIETVRTVSARYNAVLVPLDYAFAAFAAAEGAVAAAEDGIHPSAAGNQLIADCWMGAAEDAGVLG
jgi:lysophospholipase L1-like esterase